MKNWKLLIPIYGWYLAVQDEELNSEALEAYEYYHLLITVVIGFIVYRWLK